MCSSDSVDHWIATTVQKLGKLDGAVNMAGIISPAKPTTELTDKAWNFNFDVNARGVYCFLGAQLKAMAPGGSIVCFEPFAYHFGISADLKYRCL